MFHTDKNKAGEKQALIFSPNTPRSGIFPNRVDAWAKLLKTQNCPQILKGRTSFFVLADSYAILPHTTFYFFMKIMHSSYTHVHPFLLLAVLNRTSDSLKIQMLYSLWNVGAILILETSKSVPRASWKAQAAHNASRDFQGPVVTCASPPFASYSGATQPNRKADTLQPFGTCILQTSFYFGLWPWQATKKVEVQPLNPVVHTQL